MTENEGGTGPDPGGTTDPAANPPGLPRTLVVDGTPELQRWMDAFVGSAVLGLDAAWPEPHDVPYSAVTVASIWHAVESNFTVNGGVSWSVSLFGLPTVTAPDGTVLGNPAVVPDPPPFEEDPNKGSFYHNTLHSILGNFHS